MAASRARSRDGGDRLQHYRDRIVGQQRIALGKLKPHPGNWRRHPESQAQAMDAVLDNVGMVQTVVWNKRTGHVLDGHLRLELAQRRGEKALPVTVVDLAEDEERAVLATFDPIGAMAGIDEDAFRALAAEIGGADEWLAGLLESTSIAMGIDLAPPPEIREDEDEVPEPPKVPVTRPGDLWLLGGHRLLCGNSTLEDDVKRAMGKHRADIIFTDPPYGVAYHGSSASDSIAGDITQTAIPISFKQALDHATTDEARLYFCGGSSNVQMYYSLFDAYLRKMPCLIIWDKGHVVLRRNNYHSQYEVIFYGWKGSGGANEYWFGPRTSDCASDIWLVKRDPGAEYLHPTQKPVALAKRAIENSCPSGGRVYEPFSGSGSTIIAAEVTGRLCHALELAPIYVDIALCRWQTFANGVARLETGESFEEIAAARTQAAA